MPLCAICCENRKFIVPRAQFPTCSPRVNHSPVCTKCYKHYMNKHLHDPIDKVKCIFCQQAIQESALVNWMGQWHRTLLHERNSATLVQMMSKLNIMVKCHACKSVIEFDPEETNFVICRNHKTPLLTCVKHQVKFHEGETCDEYDDRISAENMRNEELSQKAIQGLIRGKCPQCQHGWFKANDEDCEHITCSCGQEFCGICLVDYNLVRRDNSYHAETCRFHSDNLPPFPK